MFDRLSELKFYITKLLKKVVAVGYIYGLLTWNKLVANNWEIT